MTLRSARGQASSRRRDEDGQSLFLLPLGLVLVLMMGLLVADTAVVFLAKREVLDAATAAANDAAAAALDTEAFRATGRLELRPDAVRALAEQAVARRGDGLFETTPSVQAWPGSQGTVVVEVRASVRGLLWSPFSAFGRSVTARVIAHAHDGVQPLS